MHNNIIVTKHAIERANERLSLNPSSFYKLSLKAINIGLMHSDCNGKLKRFLDSLYFKHKTANNIRLFAETVFIFSDNKLITIYKIPNELKQSYKKRMERKQV